MAASNASEGESVVMENIILEKLADARNVCIDTAKTSSHHAAMTIHSRIKQRRLALNLSMEQLAELAGVSSWQTVQQWEREDGTAPKRTRLDAVAKALQVSQEWLLTGNESTDDKSAKPAELNQLETQLITVLRLLSSNKEDGNLTSDQMIELLTLFKEASERGRENILSLARVASQRNNASGKRVGNDG